MADGSNPADQRIARGRTLYENREKYPLPEQTAVADYIFYYGANDGYRRSARAFLDRVYPRHEKVVIPTLAALIDRLHADVTRPNNPIQRIREVVIVGHASVHMILMPVFPGALAASDRIFQTVNAASLHELQRRVRAGGDQRVGALDTKRREVVARMTVESQVVFRGCRFGQGKEGLVALYAFFGGRANLYAPKSYMTFARRLPIGADERFTQTSDVYEHMAAQRLVKPRRRTPLRQLSLINMVAEPGFFSREAVVRDVDFTDGTAAAENLAYLEDSITLDEGRLPDSVRTALETNFDIRTPARAKGFAAIRESRAVGGGEEYWTRWQFTTPLSNNFDIHEPSLRYRPSQVFEVEILIDDIRVTGPSDTGQLIVSTRIVERDKPVGKPKRTRPKINIQLFAEDREHDLLKGVLGTYAARSHDQATPDELAAYAAEEARLDALANAPTPTIRTEVAERLTEQANLDIDPDTLTGVVNDPGADRVWLLTAGQQSILIGRDLDRKADGRLIQRLFIRSRHGPNGPMTREEFGLSVLADDSWGTNPDVPGVELMAYLDGLDDDNLRCLIDFLDSVTDTRRVELAHTWRHAVDALYDRPRPIIIDEDDLKDPLGPLESPYFPDYAFDRVIGNFLGESSASYRFPSRRHWASARYHRNAGPPAQSDLFTEWDLPAPPPWLLADAAADPPEADSPTADGRDLTDEEKQIFDSLSGDSKFELTPVSTTDDCAEFRAWLDRLRSYEGMSEADLDAALAALPEIKRPQNGNALLLASSVWSLFGMFFDRTTLSETIAVRIVQRFPRLGVVRVGGMVVPRVGGLTLPRIASLASFGLSIYFVAKYMLVNYLATVEQASLDAQRAGSQYAFRAYARRIGDILSANGNEFPETLTINILPPPGADLGEHATQTGRKLDGYVQGSIHISHSAIVEPRNLGIGFERGAKIAEEASRDALRNAETTFNRAMRRAGLDACMINALRASQLATPGRVRGLIMAQVARELQNAATSSGRGR